MEYNAFGSIGWEVSRLGYGLWSFDGYADSERERTLASLQLAVDLGCTFFDTAFVYGEGRSEQLLGELVRANAMRRLYTTTKLPTYNGEQPTRRGDLLQDAFPAHHIREATLRGLENLGLERVDVLQFHGWEDDWASDDSWKEAVTALQDEGLIGTIGISINRWEPWNVIRTLETGLIGSVQVVYNIFDQAPEDELFPACAEFGVAVIARSPLDEGGLTGFLTNETRFDESDWRSRYFAPENLVETVDRVEALKSILPAEMSLTDLTLRFILSHPTVSTVIPGMRKPEHVRANVAAWQAGPLPPSLIEALRSHRWERTFEPSWFGD